MRLSEFGTYGAVSRDAEFLVLGSIDAPVAGLLAYADTVKYLNNALDNPFLSCLVTTPDLASQVPETIGVMVSASPRQTFFLIHEHFVRESLYKLPFTPGRGEGCRIHPSAIVAEGCRIGDNVTIGEQVVIRDPVWIGSDVVVESGAKLGMEGILYHRTSTGPKLIPHGGYVRIHDGAILMANSVVVRSVHDTDQTEVGAAALIGLASIVGHEAKVGARAVVSNQCVIARKSVIGTDAFLGTNCVIKENIVVGDGAKVMAGSVVINNVPAGATVSGNFATDHRVRMLNFMRSTR